MNGRMSRHIRQVADWYIAQGVFPGKSTKTVARRMRRVHTRTRRFGYVDRERLRRG